MPVLHCTAVLAGLWATAFIDDAVAAEGIRHEVLTIPATFPGYGALKLEALVLRPADDAPHPLALINHGSPRDARDQTKMSPAEMWPQAMEFARIAR
jgi:hypothetical protein